MGLKHSLKVQKSQIYRYLLERMNRRAVLIGAASVAIGLGGCAEIVGSPKTENPIKEIGGVGFLNTFILYESGAARLVFGDDYGCYERIAVGDTPNLRGSNLRVWKLPKDGELVVDMRAAVSKTKDPSNEFWLESLGGKDSFCFGANGVTTAFTVPQDWIG